MRYDESGIFITVICDYFAYSIITGSCLVSCLMIRLRALPFVELADSSVEQFSVPESERYSHSPRHVRH